MCCIALFVTTENTDPVFFFKGSPGTVRDGKTEVPGTGEVVPEAGDVADYSWEGHSSGTVRNGKTEVPGAGGMVPGAGDVAE